MVKKELIKLLEAGNVIYQTCESPEGKKTVYREQGVYAPDGTWVAFIEDRNISYVRGLIELTQVIQDGVEQPTGTYPYDKGPDVAWKYRVKYELKKL